MTAKNHEIVERAPPSAPTPTGKAIPPASDDERHRLFEEKPYDFIERTRPEDRIPADIGRGQLTRDNVNPNIPSAPPGGGAIVDPNTLGMPQDVAGVAPPAVTPTDAPLGTGSLASINEPLGSTIGSQNPGGPGGPVTPPGVDPPDLLDLDPDVATIGDVDLLLTCTGEDFDPSCVITFNGGDEPTTFVSVNTLTTVVRPSTATTPGSYPVTVRNGAGESDPLDFEFVEPAQRDVIKSRAKKPKKAPRKKR